MTRGLSSVYGFIVIFMLTIAALEASSLSMSSLVSLQASHDRADQLGSMQKLEHLALSLSNGTLAITNDGVVPSTIRYLHFAMPSSSSDAATDERLAVGQTLQLNAQAAGAISVVTSLGNVFWTSSPMPSPGTTYAVTFDAKGVPAGAGQILTVDGTAYGYNQLPLTFNWASGEAHAFAYVSGVPAGAGTRVGWTDTRGLTTSQTGQLIVAQSGQVIADYLTQYQLTVVNGGGVLTTPASPTNDGWFNAGTTVYVATDNVWNDVSNQSRDNLVSWSVDGATPSLVTRSGSGTFTTGGVVMNGPHVLSFNPVTQYFLQLQPSLPASGSVPSLTVGFQYTDQSTVTQALSNPGFETGSLSPWSQACQYGTTGVSSAVVHSGAYAAFSSYPTDSGACLISQSFAAPPGATILSASGSAFVYFNGVGSAWMSESCGSYWGVSASSANSWQPLSKSDSCPGGTTGVTFSLGVQGNCVLKCFTGSAYWDDAAFSYVYSMPHSGTTDTTANGYNYSGGAITYNYLVAYTFPSGSYARQLRTTLPSTETISKILVGSGPSALTSSEYAVSGGTITIPDSTIASYGGAYALVSSSGAGYSASQSGSPTADNWYDSGSTATISASATAPVAFSSWSGSPTISSASSITTTVVMSNYYAVTAKFAVNP